MAVHKDITGDEAIHPAAYVQSSDPGAVGAYRLWIDTSVTPAISKYRNAGDTDWVTFGGSGTGSMDDALVLAYAIGLG